MLEYIVSRSRVAERIIYVQAPGDTHYAQTTVNINLKSRLDETTVTRTNDYTPTISREFKCGKARLRKQSASPDIARVPSIPFVLGNPQICGSNL